jgi:hypothetical protein
MCYDHQVLSDLLSDAKSILKTKVTVAGSDGPTTPVDVDDVFLEAVSVRPDDPAGFIICSVTIAANGITERVAYSVLPVASDSHDHSFMIKFGGGPGGGGHELFPETVTVRPDPSGLPRVMPPKLWVVGVCVAIDAAGALDCDHVSPGYATEEECRDEANRLKKNGADVKAADCMALQTDNPPGSLFKITRPHP